MIWDGGIASASEVLSHGPMLAVVSPTAPLSSPHRVVIGVVDEAPCAAAASPPSSPQPQRAQGARRRSRNKKRQQQQQEEGSDLVNGGNGSGSGGGGGGGGGGGDGGGDGGGGGGGGDESCTGVITLGPYVCPLRGMSTPVLHVHGAEGDEHLHQARDPTDVDASGEGGGGGGGGSRGGVPAGFYVLPSADGSIVCFALDSSTPVAARWSFYRWLGSRATLMAWVIPPWESEVVTLTPPAEEVNGGERRVASSRTAPLPCASLTPHRYRCPMPLSLTHTHSHTHTHTSPSPKRASSPSALAPHSLRIPHHTPYLITHYLSDLRPSFAALCALQARRRCSPPPYSALAVRSST